MRDVGEHATPKSEFRVDTEEAQPRGAAEQTPKGRRVKGSETRGSDLCDRKGSRGRGGGAAEGSSKGQTCEPKGREVMGDKDGERQAYTEGNPCEGGHKFGAGKRESRGKRSEWGGKACIHVGGGELEATLEKGVKQ